MTRPRRPTVAPVNRRLLPALAAAVISAWGGGLDAQGPGSVRIDSVAVTGNLLMQTAPLVGTIGIFPGDTITFREVQNAEKRLWATGRFADITVTADESPDGLVALTFDVEEYPIIRQRRIEGLEFVSESSVWEEIGLEAGTPYTPQLFAEAREYIRSELAEEGIPYVQVEEEVTPVAENPGSANLVIRVEEGQRVTIAEIAFNGNEAFPDGELEGAVSSRSEGFFWFQSGAYQAVELEEDLGTRLPQFYASHGYLDFEVLGDTLIVDPTNGKARLEIDVQEGPQYLVGEFSIDGNRQFMTEELRQYYQPGAGGLLQSLGIGGPEGGDPVFDLSAFEDATSQVASLYSNSGYLYSQVSPQIERQEPEAEGENPRVALHWLIEEGQPAYVRRIFIEGNDYTHDRVIRERIQLLPGDLYSEDRLMRSYQAISGLGFFEAPLPVPEITPDPATGDIDVTFSVEERSTGSVNFGTTVGGYTGLAGFVGYDQPNLFGQAKSGSFRWDYGRYQNNLTLTYTDPAIRLSRVSGSVSVYNARDRFFSFSTGRRRVLGASTQFGVPVAGSLFTRVFAGYSLSRTVYHLDGGVQDTSLFGRPPGVMSQLSLGIARNTLDHPLFPTVGSEVRWTTELNGGVLGGDGNFTKHLAEGSWWIPVGSFGGGTPGSQPARFALGIRARSGMITGDAGAFPFERFWLGGVQFGEPLRGYEETTLTPLGHVERGSGTVRDVQRLGDAFLSISAEYALRISTNISIAAFYDAGGIWRSPVEMDPSRLYRGAGLGLELVTPFGPFGLDYAYGFDKANPGWQFHFRMGGQQAL